MTTRFAAVLLMSITLSSIGTSASAQNSNPAPNSPSRPPVNDPVIDLKKQAQQTRPGQAVPDSKGKPAEGKDGPKEAPKDATKDAPKVEPRVNPEGAKPAVPNAPTKPESPNAAPDPASNMRPVAPNAPAKTAPAAPAAKPKPSPADTGSTLRRSSTGDGIKGQVTQLTGQAQCRQLAPTAGVLPGAWRELAASEGLQGLVELRTGPQSRLTVTLADGSSLTLMPLTRVRLSTLKNSESQDENAPRRLWVAMQRGRMGVSTSDAHPIFVAHEKSQLTVSGNAEVSLDAQGLRIGGPESPPAQP